MSIAPALCESVSAFASRWVSTKDNAFILSREKGNRDHHNISAPDRMGSLFSPTPEWRVGVLGYDAYFFL